MRKGLKDWRKAPTGSVTAALLATLERRWALRVIWELRGGALTFRALQAACGGISPSVLQARLHGWQRVAVIEKIPRLGYRLSSNGELLYQSLEAVAEWGERHDGNVPANNKLLYK